jgi:hypothetical protein
VLGQTNEFMGSVSDQQSRFSDHPFHHETGESLTEGINVSDSDARLVEQYQLLMCTEQFPRLDIVTRAAGKITLTDSSSIPGQPTDYNVNSHEIRVPLLQADGTTRSLADVRSGILWEMHNACNKDMYDFLDKMNRNPPQEGATRKDWINYKYTHGSLKSGRKNEKLVNSGNERSPED